MKRRLQSIFFLFTQKQNAEAQSDRRSRVMKGMLLLLLHKQPDEHSSASNK